MTEVEKHFEQWKHDNRVLIEKIEGKYVFPSDHYLVKVYRYSPPETSLVDTSKRIIGIKGNDLSKETRERNYPIAIVLGVGDNLGSSNLGKLKNLPLALSEDRINPLWEQFNKEAKERPLPQEISVPDMFIEGLEAWGKHAFSLDCLNPDPERDRNLFLVPTAFLKGTINEV